MKKRFFSLLLVLAMVLSLLPVTTFAADIVDSGTCGDNVTWTLDSDGVLTISGTGAMRDYSWDESPFYNNASITRLVIRQDVTSIGEYAFCSCDSLVSVTIQNSVTSIGDGAFEFCDSLKSVTIPNSVTSIGDGAFEFCDSLKSVTIPNSVTSIGDYALSGIEGTIHYEGTVQQWESVSFNQKHHLDGPVQCRDGIIEPFIVRSTVELNGDKAPNGNRDGETNLGDLVADALVWFVLKDTKLKVPVENVVGVTNGGGIRAWIHAGDVTMKDINTVLPFGNTVAVAYVTGAQLLEVLEASTFKAPEAVGGFPQVTGMKFTLNTGKPFDQGEQYPDSTYYGPKSIQRVTINEVNGKPFNKNTVYAVVTNNYCAAGGDTYYAFKSASEQFDTNVPLDDALMDYIVEKLGGVIGSDYAAPQGHIVIVDQPTDPSDPGNPGEMEILPPMETPGVFHYFSNQLAKRNLIKVKDEVAEYTYDYDEGWFEKSTSQYQHDLAKMSLRMAMAGMARINIDAPTDTTNIRELFNNLKFKNVECEYPEPEENSIGYAIGSKNIRGSDGKEYSLVAVVVRSAGYQEEWGGNVTLGPSGNHKGFQTAADKLLNGLKSGGGIRDESGVFNYVSRLQQTGLLTENVKIWITGYSRGAAVANLAAAKLNKEYGKANVFAYSFECPQGAYGESAEGESYNNIFSIVNPIDLVTKVAMSEWNFTRYGKTYYLPSLSNTVKYLPLKVKMEQEYAKLLKYNGGSNVEQGVKSVTKELAGVPGLLDQSAIFDRFVTNIARNMGSRSAYYNLHERGFSTAIAHLEDMSESGEVTEDDILSILTLLGMEMAGKTAIVSLSPALQMLAMAEVEVEAFALATCMAYAHFPELCLAWLEALDGETICNLLTGYRTVIINCPVDVSVYDADHRLVAQILNDTPQELENGVSAYVDLNGQKIVVLPCDMEYTLNVKATDNGTVSYTVADYDMDKGAYTQVVSYQNLPVQKNDILIGAAPEELADTTVSYALTTEDGEVITPDVKQQGDAVQLWNVRLDAEEGGTATGSGAFLCGEYARVSAEAESGYRFLGWFEGEKKVSEDAEYRFAVEKDTALTAKFERTTPLPSNPFTDVKESAYYYEPVLWAVNHVPQITNGTGDKTFSPEWECQRCQIVTFLWRAMGCPEPTSTRNPFVDVKPADYFYKAVLWAVEKGITNGMDLTHFDPTSTCTRGQAVTFLWRAEGKPAPRTQRSEFTDVQNPNDYFYTPVLWAVENGITNGTGNGLFSPNMICLREQIVTFLYRDLK